jgi:peptidoglycan/xylan/chitin deacetylase (PgdA/CDA1 family)
MTVDVEDYFHVSAFDRVLSRDDWPAQESRVEANTERLLALLAEHRVRATCFVLGWVAERWPGLVKAIAAGGHEVASHGYCIGWFTPRPRTSSARTFGVPVR